MYYDEKIWETSFFIIFSPYNDSQNNANFGVGNIVLNQHLL